MNPSLILLQLMKAINIPLQYENVFVVFEKNLQSSDLYEFLPQAILCILVRVYNLLSLWHFLKHFLLFKMEKVNVDIQLEEYMS